MMSVQSACRFTVVTQGGGLSGGSVMPEDQSRKREMRLLKNR